MGASHPLRPVHILPVLLGVFLCLGGPQRGEAAHDLGQDCYNCHNIKSGRVWVNSFSIWDNVQIGMPSYANPITCEVCHTDYGNRFKAGSESHHPVAVISGTAMNSDYDNGVRISCRDCHSGNNVRYLPAPDLDPDVSPLNYFGLGGNGPLDGYPNHDAISPPVNQVNTGDEPHLGAMRLYEVLGADDPGGQHVQSHPLLEPCGGLRLLLLLP